jgi:hypothetical protein
MELERIKKGQARQASIKNAQFIQRIANVFVPYSLSLPLAT